MDEQQRGWRFVIPTSGGVSDKFGNRYEGRWTVVQLAKVLSEATNSLWLDPWDSTGDGVEFVLRVTDHDDYHQLKRQVSGATRWTVDRLADEGVRAAAKTHLAEPRARFTFLSTSPSQLRELAERAQTSDSIAALDAQHSKETRTSFVAVSKAWAPGNSAQVFDALQRFDAAVLDEPRVLELARAHVGALVSGDPDTVIDTRVKSTPIKSGHTSRRAAIQPMHGGVMPASWSASMSSAGALWLRVSDFSQADLSLRARSRMTSLSW